MPSEPLAATVRRATPPAGPEAVFRMLKVCKVYRMGEAEVHALRDVNLELLPDEFAVLLGASGSGKSTLLNILGGLDLRLWLNDDPAQNKPIDTLLAAHGSMPGSLLVTDVVLVEAVWTLKSAFQQDPQAQALAVRSLLAETAFAFEDRDAVAAAPGPFEAGSCEFADSLVVAKHVRQGCDFTATFDRRMRKLPGVKVH